MERLRIVHARRRRPRSCSTGMRTLAGRLFSLVLGVFSLACTALLFLAAWSVLFRSPETWKRPLRADLLVGRYHVNHSALIPGVAADSLVEETGSAWAASSECERGNVDTIFLFPSSPGAWQNRAALRNTLLSQWAREFFNWTGVFLIGLEETVDPDGPTNAWTDLEATAIGDMVRLNTNDDYASMMAKFLVGLHWATLHCPRLRYVVKADDDVAVEPVLLRRYLDGQVRLTSRVIYCSNQHYNRVLRHRSFSPRDESLGESDHRYCSGRTVVMNIATAEDLVRASRVVPSHSADDVYVTGDLALVARVSHRSLGFSGAREPEGVDAVILGSHMLAHMDSAFDQTTGRRAAWHAALWKWASRASGDTRAVALRRGAHLFATTMRTESAIGNMLRREPLRTTQRASS